MKAVERLMARALEGPLDPAECRELCERLREDPELREQFAVRAALHGLLGPALEDDLTRERKTAAILEAVRAADESEFAAKVQRKLAGIRRRKVLVWTATAVAALVVLGLFLRPSAPEPLATVAQIASQDSASSYRIGDPFAAGGRLDLPAGLLELDLQGRGTMIVEGPAELEFTGPLGAKLERGRVLLHVNEAGHGYQLKSPRGNIVDLGTTFGVSVDEATGEVETHVIAGEVKTFSGDSGEVVLLRENEALRFGLDSNVRIPVDFGAFYTSLPPAPQKSSRMVHWPMDLLEMSGSGARTHGFDDVDFDLYFPRESDAGLPRLIDGPFGQALYFDGKGSYAESQFRGIDGARARTVAFWVKVPEDFELEQGYSMLSWGQFSAEDHGSVWQVSVNPDEADGPVGRLRVGVHGGKAIGSTDLRDGRWHHLAVVLYEVPGRRFGKNVLLFVNGEPEPLSTRVLSVMNTQVEGMTHGVWLGRDVTSTAESSRFFRGGLDEVYIFDVALTQGEVRELMHLNQPPG